MIPVLPDELADLLDDVTPASDPASDAEVTAFLGKHTAATRPEILAGWVKALGNNFAAGASRHESTLTVLVGALKEARAGYFPARDAVDTIRPMFIEEVAKPPTSKHQNAARTGKVAADEFDGKGGILSWAVGQADAADLDDVHARVGAQMPGNVKFVDVSAFAVNGQAATSGKRKTRNTHADFWEATDELRCVRDWARSRRVGPFGMLGPVMARVVTTIPPTVQIPPYVGARASLNLFVNLVAESGGRKGGTLGAARDAVDTAHVYATGPGSGEGINHLFAYYDKKADATVFRRRNVFFSVPEVDTLGGLDKRSGSTLLSQLCKAWSGEDLTFAYVDRTKALVIPDHSYRLCMVVGVQPGRAGTLLDATDAGVPQRFLWLPTDDPDAPDVRPPEPAPLDCLEVAKYWPDIGKPIRLLNLPPAAKAQIEADALAKVRGKGDPDLDGHLGLCRIKVAIALALLHGKPWEVTDLYWDLAGVVMDVSQETRTRVEIYRAAKGDEEEQRRGKREGVRAVAAETVKADEAIKRVAKGIVRYLKSHGQTPHGVTRRDSTPHRDRDYFDEALERLIDAGQVEVVSGGAGELLRLVSP